MQVFYPTVVLIVAVLSAAAAHNRLHAGGVAPFTSEHSARGVIYNTMFAPPLTNPQDGFGLAVADLDGDADLDLVLLGRPDGLVGLYENNGLGIFANRSTGSGIPATLAGCGVAAFDFDADVEAVQEVFPKCCIHFEDWTGVDAMHLLERYRNKACVFNDDIQGTAGITLAGMINATKMKGTQLKDEKYLFLGAGSAGIGLANLLCSALAQQGMSLQDAQARVHMFDVNGLLESTRTDLYDFQKPYAHPHAPTRNFVEAIESIKPTTIIGVSTIGGAFTKEVIEAMTRINARPVVLALSNPTSCAECTPEQAYTWSNGKAIYAAGVPFAPVHMNGTTFIPGQANNFFIYPAVAMAIYATEASRVTDSMFIEAASAVADQVPPELFKQGLMYPPQSNILETEIKTAARVAKLIFDLGLARVARPADMEALIRSHVYTPTYPKLV